MIIDLERISKIHGWTERVVYDVKRVKQEVLKRKTEFSSMGFGRGEICVIKSGNSLQFFVDLFAIWEIQGIVLVVGKSVSCFAQNRIFELLPISLVVRRDGVAEKVSHPRSKGEAGLSGPLLLLSSGTTGVPKIVEIRAERLVDRITNIGKMIGSQVEVGLNFLSTSFGHGLIANSLALMNQGKELVIAPEFDLNMPLELEKLVLEKRIDFFSTVPSHYAMISKMLKGSVCSEAHLELHCASSHLTSPYFTAAMGLFPNASFRYHYGMTEMGSWMTQKSLDASARIIDPYNVGVPYGVEFRTIEGHDNLYVQNSLCDINTLNLFDGSIARTGVGDIFDTKDLGGISSSGEVQVLGRAGEFINKGGLKVSPFEIERVVTEAVATNGCIAIAIPSNFYGEDIGIVLVGCAGGAELEEQIKTLCSAQLGAHCVPKMFYYVDELSPGGNGKVSRRALAELFNAEKEIK